MRSYKPQPNIFLQRTQQSWTTYDTTWYDITTWYELSGPWYWYASCTKMKSYSLVHTRNNDCDILRSIGYLIPGMNTRITMKTNILVGFDQPAGYSIFGRRLNGRRVRIKASNLEVKIGGGVGGSSATSRPPGPRHESQLSQSVAMA